MYELKESRLIDQLKTDNGIHRALVTHRRPCTVTIGGDRDHPGAVDFARRLEAFTDLHGPIQKLYPYQIRAAVNIAYRPSSVTAEIAAAPHDRAKTFSNAYDYDGRGEDDDIGAISLNDLFTGSGKTLVSALAALEVATRRGASIEARGRLLFREQNTAINWAGGSSNRAEPAYKRVVLAFCPRHLTGQWKAAADAAVKIMGCEAMVAINPIPSAVEAGLAVLALRPGAIMFLIYDHVQKVSPKLKFVPCIVNDEFITRGDFNFATRAAADGQTILFGRLILISADAGNVMRLLPSLRNACIVKRWAQTTSRWTWVDSAMMMATGSSVSTAGRVDISASMGMETPLFIHTVRYVPTISGALFGSEFEVSQRSGTERFARMGVDASGCRTTDDVLTAIGRRLALPEETLDGGVPVPGESLPERQRNRALIVANDKRTREALHDCVKRMREFMTDEAVQCPVCLDPIRQAAIVHPCWHVTCADCMKVLVARRDRQHCPMCRARISGLVTSEVREEEVEAPRAGGGGFRGTIGESIRSLLGDAPGLFKTVLAILLSLEHHERAAPASDEPFRVLVAAPEGVDFDQLRTAFREHVPATAAWMSHFKVSGTARERITANCIRSQLEAFATPTGPPMRILFTAEGAKDSMTGLDLPTVDVLVAVGEGNTTQRLGRLTRLGRKFSRGAVHLFDVLPVSR